MGKLLGIVLIILGIILLFFWAIPFLDGTSLLGIAWNSIIGFILIFAGLITFFSRPRIN